MLVIKDRDGILVVTAAVNFYGDKLARIYIYSWLFFLTFKIEITLTKDVRKVSLIQEFNIFMVKD